MPGPAQRAKTRCDEKVEIWAPRLAIVSGRRTWRVRVDGGAADHEWHVVARVGERPLVLELVTSGDRWARFTACVWDAPPWADALDERLGADADLRRVRTVLLAGVTRRRRCSTSTTSSNRCFAVGLATTVPDVLAVGVDEVPVRLLVKNASSRAAPAGNRPDAFGDPAQCWSPGGGGGEGERAATCGPPAKRVALRLWDTTIGVSL
jgi:hypothetical protein